MENARYAVNGVSSLCSLGLFIAGYIFYSSSLIEMFYAQEFALSSWQIGFAQSAVPLGAMLGAVLAGRLADILGRHRLLVWNFLFLSVIGLLSGLAFNYSSLCLTRLFSGFLAGTLYPLCATYLIEMTPHASLARQSAFLMFINCLAAPVACIVAMILSCFFNEPILWRLITVGYAMPAFIALCWSTTFTESKEWLEAEERLHQTTLKKEQTTVTHLFSGIKVLFNLTYRQVTCCLLGTWFLMDVAYFGINFFVPYLLQAMSIKSLSANFSQHSSSLLSNETVWGTFVINLFFMLSAFFAIFIVEKVDLIKLQKYGFLFSSVSLFLLALYFFAGLHINYMVILLFVLFNFALNLGPDVTTYLLSATSYPVEMRGSGHGMIAGFAKFGSFLGVLLLPRLQDAVGYQIVILLLAILLFFAYMLTSVLAKTVLQDQTMVEANIVYEAN